MAYNPSSSSNNLLGSLEGSITADVSDAEQGRVHHPSGHPPPPGSTTPLQPPPPSSRGSVPVQGLSSEQASAQDSIWKQSAHPVALFFLYAFRCAAIATYLLCGFFSSSYVFSTVLVVVLLSLDFWTVRNVSGRVLVGLRFWNQVDEDGTSYWVFESRSPDQPANAVDAKMFWIAMYSFPVAWVLLLVIGILKFNLSFLPIVMLALVFNLTNTWGYTYGGSSPLSEGEIHKRVSLTFGSRSSPVQRYAPDRDAKRRWATGMAAGGMLGQVGGLGGSIVSGLASSAYSRFFS
ncbi:Tvp23p [Rhodotorula paludigena]|uniref:Tvp23p n=1 Tax=Rhodotorula paludigena TaxID=86838 RepID=UPI00316FADC2